MDCGLWTTDFGLGIKHGLWTEYKTRTTVYVYKNSFRNVLKTERNGMRTSVKQWSQLLASHTNIPFNSWSCSLFSPTSASCGEGKHTTWKRKVMPLLKGNEIKL